MKDITFGIKTFQRYDSLRDLFKSIEYYYPKAKIIVADDSEKIDTLFYVAWKKKLDITLLKMPFDSGLSAGRNLMVEHCKTDYFLLLDDDFVFTEETKIEKFYEIIKSNKKIGLVGGLCLESGREIHYEHKLEIKDGILYQQYDGDNWEEINGIQAKKTGCVLNFGLFRTALFKDIKWDNNLKLSEHTDYFLRFPKKWLIYYTPEVRVIHAKNRLDIDYAKYRRRGTYYSTLMFKKHKIKKQISITGSVTELRGDRFVIYKIAV